MEGDVFYVGVQSPVELRRACLLSSKALLDILKRYEDASLLRQEKAESIAELKHLFDEIIVLNRKLRSKLPKVAVPSEKPAPVEVPKKNVVKTKTHMDLLEDELSKIEERLEALK